jgi:hypothetical protein
MFFAAELEALDDLILGRGVRRGRHFLSVQDGELFARRLSVCGFRERRVGEVDIEVGVRVPAWFLSGTTADFGMVFWEIFTHRSKRKLFASEVRNAKGDWEIQLGPASPQPVFVNLDLAERYDASRPVGMY